MSRYRAPALDAAKAHFWLLLALLVWAPIPLGSNRPWAWAVLEVCVYVLLAMWVLLWACGRVELSAPAQKAWPAWALLAAWLAVQWLYLVPMPFGWVEALNPEAAHMHALVRQLGITPSTVSLSVDPDAARISFHKTIAYVGVFFLIVNVANRRSRIATLTRVLVYAAVINAVYAVLMHLTGTDGDWFGTPMVHSAQASGTYANRNHYAAFLYMALAMGVGLMIAGQSDRSADTWKKRMKHTIEWILSPKMVLRLSLCAYSKK